MADLHPALGFFDNPYEDTPAHDPGLDVPCVVCPRPLRDGPRVTVSVCPHPDLNPERSLFFRAHRRCWDALSDRERGLIESSFIDREVKNGPEPEGAEADKW